MLEGGGFLRELDTTMRVIVQMLCRRRARMPALRCILAPSKAFVLNLNDDGVVGAAIEDEDVRGGALFLWLAIGRPNLMSPSAARLRGPAANPAQQEQGTAIGRRFDAEEKGRGCMYVEARG